uniref:Trichome birefringence-like N-terminal domain-containing protein n=1 Tax=Zea mays TaxID=4577 RepID=A0A804UAN4_MAIZE
MPSTPWLPWRLAVPIAAALASVPFILPLVLPLLLRSNASPRALSVNRLTWLPSPAIRTATTVSPPLAPLLSPSQPSAPSPPVIHMSPSPSPPPPSPPASLAPPSPPMIQAPRSPPPPPPIQAPLSPPSQSIQAPHPPPPPHSSSPPPPESMATDEKAGETETRRCDVYDGEWVQDEEARPLYPPGTCPYVDEAYACAANGRPDSRYTRWRWAPRHCSLPRFNATDFLHRLRGKRLLLVGDSMNRNQFESMLCVLREALPDKARMFETHGYRISKGRGYFVFKFPCVCVCLLTNGRIGLRLHRGVRAVAFPGPRRGALQQAGELQPDPPDRPHRQDGEPVEEGRRARLQHRPLVDARQDGQRTELLQGRRHAVRSIRLD